MQIRIDSKSFFIFDLDDTLFQEIDFLRSAYRHIAVKLSPYLKCNLYEEMIVRYSNRENVFQWIIKKYQQLIPELTLTWLLKEYREHLPSITLSKETSDFLQELKNRKLPAGLITDGRSTTQRNKLKALGIENYFQDIIISEEFGSEKPDERNYLFFQNKYPGMSFYFFGDNTSKDFIVPEKLGWQTICLKNSGSNIHEQSLTNGIACHLISSFKEINLVP